MVVYNILLLEIWSSSECSGYRVFGQVNSVCVFVIVKEQVTQNSSLIKTFWTTTIKHCDTEKQDMLTHTCVHTYTQIIVYYMTPLSPQLNSFIKEEKQSGTQITFRN